MTRRLTSASRTTPVRWWSVPLRNSMSALVFAVGDVELDDRPQMGRVRAVEAHREVVEQHVGGHRRRRRQG